MTNESLLSGKSESFYSCLCCGVKWHCRDELLSDPEVNLLGYQVHFDCLKLGLFLFNHSCKSTFSLKAEVFFDLYDGPVYKEKLAGSETCPGYCLKQNSLAPCSAKCECAFVREIIQIIKNFPKK
jgi:hypothetical protein